MKQVKVKCPKCGEKFYLNKNMHDEGDSIECPECDTASIIAVKSGKLVLEPEDKYAGFEEEEYYDEIEEY